MIPTKKLLLAVAMVMVLSQAALAQVKKQYQDKVFTQTTIVVKEDQATDTEVLDAYDLDDIGMDQVIRITTEADKPQLVSNTPPPVETTTAEVPRKVVKQAVTPPTNIAKEPAPAPVAVQEKTTPAVKSTVRRGSSKRSSAKRKYSKKRKRGKTKRVKLKKRKRIKKNRGKCYKF